jgi:hypothetical protein
MGFFTAALSVGLVLAHASDPMADALQRLEATQLQALALSGSFLQQQGVWAPWMQHPQMDGHRRLAGQDALLTLPAACKSACPSAESTMNGLKSKMMAAMMPHAQALASMSSNTGGKTTPAELKATMEKMMPMLKDILKITFQDMCANKATYVCMTTNQAVCMDQNQISTGMDFNNPAAMAKSYGPVLGCICDACPGSLQVYTDLSTSLMSVLLTAFSSMGQNSNNAAQPEEIKQEMMKAMCPFAGLERCFAANPNQCSAITQGNQMGSGMAGVGLSSGSNMSALKVECGKMGISTQSGTALTPVTTEMKITGIDFAKVNSDATLKKSIIDGIKAKFVAALKGIRAEDIMVALSSGSLKAAVTITPVPGSTSELLKTAITAAKTTVSNAVLAEVKAMPNIASVLETGVTPSQLTMTAEAPTVGGAPQQAISKAFSPHGLAVFGVMVALLVQLLM